MADSKILDKNRAGKNATTTSTNNKKMVVRSSKLSLKKDNSISTSRRKKLLKLLKGNNPRIKRKSQQIIFQRKQSKNDKNNVNQEPLDSTNKSQPVNTQSISRRQRIRESRRDELKQQQHDLMMRPNKVDTTIASAPVTNNDTEQKNEKTNTQVFLNRKNRQEKIRNQRKKSNTYKGYISKVKLEKQQGQQEKISTNTTNLRHKNQKRALHLSKNEQLEKKKRNNKRKEGKKKVAAKRNMRAKLDNMLKDQISPKNPFKNKIKDLIIDKVGRDEEGNLNLVGMLITMLIILKLPILLKLIVIILIVAVVIAIISIFVSFWTTILSLFVVKTESMMITEAYNYVTWLDTYKNKEVYDTYNRLVDDPEHDEVYFEVNGIESDPEQFMYVSNGDNYIYYLNAKFEDYDIDNTAIVTYRKRVAEKTGVWIPWSSRDNTYAVFHDAPHPLSPEPIKVFTVKDEIHALHDMVYNYTTVIEKDKEVETVVITVDKETGEEHTEVKREKKNVATVKINVQTIGEMFDSDPEVGVYVARRYSREDDYYGRVIAFDEDEVDKYYPIMEKDRFEDKIFMANPFGKMNYANVVDNFGYRRRNPNTQHYEIALEAEPGTPVYATTFETVESINYSYQAGHTDGSAPVTTAIETDTGLYYAYYVNIDPVVRPGRTLEAGDLIGYTRNQFDGNLLVAMKEYRFWHKDPDVYPAIYINNLVFSTDTNLAYMRNGGGLHGNLINPPLAVTKWQNRVAEQTSKHGIEAFTNAILSMIWVESGGNEAIQPDIMNAQLALSSPDRITTPEESIEKGVEYFAYLLKKAQSNNLNGLAAVQAYNYGEAYLDDLIKRNAPYSFEDARLYAQMKSNNQTIPFNHIVAQGLGYNWRYIFGNMFYTAMVTRNIMADTGRLAELARRELGNPNGEKYWRWAGFNNRMEWSAVFVSWIANEAGYLEQGRVLNTANVLDMKEWFEANDKFKTYDENYVPQSGDLVFFDWTGGRTGKDHVGIVEYSGGNIIQVIEGNSDNLVRRRTYAIGSNVISGYGLP
ncbi:MULTISPECIES: lysozyme family protein [unclassified Enterococcus]|uniref:lysozyme family protein n=1 Tax=unclassified Enterococcus TaxID=2608891 RepID=UPI003F206D3E